MSTPRGQAEAAIEVLAKQIRGRFGDSTLTIAFYGSALRDDQPVDDGLFDLLVVVDGYRRAYRKWTLSLLNAALPPNVFYLEEPFAQTRIRAKYAVVSLSQLRRYTRRRCLQTYFWGRLAQPVEIVYARDDAARGAFRDVLRQAVTTFAASTAPRLPASFDVAALWRRGLELSYGTEFRPERKERARTLTEHGIETYRDLARDAATTLGWEADGADGDLRFVTRISSLRRGWSRVAWLARRIQGRVLHVLRLVKATWTFDGGIDYLVWKVERHSGVKVEVSERARRHPVLCGWWTLWRLRRKGGFR